MVTLSSRVLYYQFIGPRFDPWLHTHFLCNASLSRMNTQPINSPGIFPPDSIEQNRFVSVTCHYPPTTLGGERLLPNKARQVNVMMFKGLIVEYKGNNMKIEYEKSVRGNAQQQSFRISIYRTWVWPPVTYTFSSNMSLP